MNPSPAFRDGLVTVYLGDARDVMAELSAESVDCAITSPPYWGLRDYQVRPLVWGGDAACPHRWGQMERGKRGDLRPVDASRVRSRVGTTPASGLAAANGGCFCRRCGAWLGSLGLEPTPELYVAHLVEVMRQVRRVLKPGGTLWLVLGDSYAGKGTPAKHLGLAAWSAANARGGAHKQERTGPPPRHLVPGLKPKDLVGIPWRVAFALQADGWWLRADVVVGKKNPIPESVRDRPTRSHDFLFLLAPSARYFYDHVAVRQPCASGPSDVRKMVEGLPRLGGKHRRLDDPFSSASAATNVGRHRSVGDPSGRNLRTVWSMGTHPYHGAHFAAFPPALVEPCVLAGTSAHGCCPDCGAPWRRTGPAAGDWRPGCVCGHTERVPAVVLDPFAGSGTTAAVAARLGRRAVAVELNPRYLTLIRERVSKASRDRDAGSQTREGTRWAA